MSGGKTTELPSIFALAPLEEGGTIARVGFAYQDHVAAGYCIEMLRNAQLCEVWCEAEDDITLLWDKGNGVVVELIQVKASNPGQFWSIALLCSDSEKSIAAKSLAHDRCSEPCIFRIVTRVGVNKELTILTTPVIHGDRALSNPKMLSVHKDVCTRLGDLQSPRGLSPSHWLSDTVWEVTESEEALERRNLAHLDEYLEMIGHPLFIDQRKDLYDRLLRRVQQASFPKWSVGGDTKKLQRAPLSQWLLLQIVAVEGSATGKAGAVMRKKMDAALIPSGTIDTADDLRRKYRRRSIDPKYLTDDESRDAEAEVIASLNHLLAQLDANVLHADGPSFHAQCLGVVSEVRKQFPTMSLSTLQGVMYVATDRCRHRFLAVDA